MTRRRIILGSPTQTGLIDELRLRIGEVGNDFSTGVATQRATSFGSGGTISLGARGDHQHPFMIAPKSLIQPASPTTSTAGISEYFPRGDHIHFVDPGNIAYGVSPQNVSVSTSTAGITGAASRDDHVHYLPPGNAAADVNLATSTAGVAGNVSRGDHAHYLAPGGTASDISWATGTAGIGANVSRGDHVHKLSPGALVPAAARVTAHTYTNNGAGPLWVMISHAIGTGGLTSVIDVDGVQAAEVGPTALRPIQIMSVVAPKSEYYFSSTASSVTIKNWAEYQF